MEEYDCPSREQNQQEHSYFIDRLKETRQFLKEQGANPDLADKLHRELRMWFIGHIGRIDKELAHSMGNEAELKRQRKSA